MKTLVWLASYPKSGSTWTRAFLAAYASNATGPIDLLEINRFSRSDSRFELFCQASDKSREELTDLEIDSLRERVQAAMSERFPRYCTIKTHNARVRRNDFPLVRREFTKAAVYIVRNPLDVVDSLADHSNLTIEQAITSLENRRHWIGGPNSKLVNQYLDTWSTHVESWLSAQGTFPLHVVRYEDLKIQPHETFGGLIRFLGWEFDPGRLDRAIRFSDFHVLQQLESEQGFTEASAVAKSKRFFRHGVVNRWRDVLTQSQVERICDHHGRTMEKLGYAELR